MDFKKFIENIPKTETREKVSKIETALKNNKVYVSYSETKKAFFIYTDINDFKKKKQVKENETILKYLKENKTLCEFSEKAREKVL